MPFLSKKKSTSSASSMSSASTAASASSKKSNPQSFAKFDEKKDYVRRCNEKHPPQKKATPCSVSFCLGKKL